MTRDRVRQLTIAALALFAAAFVPLSSAQAWTDNVLYSFCAQSNCSDGQAPAGDLVMDTHGNFFGTTADGGDTQGDGVAFELVHRGKSWKYKTLYTFCQQQFCADGRNPRGHLVLDVNGNLYGITSGHYQADTIFRLSHETGAWVLQTLFSFCPTGQNCINGTAPDGSLTYVGAASGAPYDGTSPLYGVAGGGLYDDGVAYQLTLRNGSWKEAVIYNFCSLQDCLDGEGPNGPLLADGAGNLYGTTFLGGTTSTAGVLFELSPSKNGWRETVLHDFCDPYPCVDGTFAEGQLAFDGAGDLLGTTILGGKNNGGILYRLVPNGKNSQFSKLHDFCNKTDCLDGASPGSGVIVASNGDIFGVTQEGGNKDQFGQPAGVAFRLSGSTYKVIYLFCSEQPDCTDGTFPNSNLIWDPRGHLYGIAEVGGAFDGGAVYELFH